MKKLLNSPIILQMICVVLAMFLVHHIGLNKASKEVISRVIGDHLPDAIESIEKNNALLLGVYMAGAVDDSLELSDEGIRDLSFISWQLEEVIGVEFRPFMWWDFDRVGWVLDDMKSKSSLSQADLNYIEDVRTIHQEFIDLYYKIIEEEGLDFQIGYRNKEKIFPVYKRFIEGANIIASSEDYEAVDDYEVTHDAASGNHQEAPLQLEPQALISKEEAEILVGDFLKRATDEIPILEYDEDENYYEFEKVREERFEDGIYNVRVEKNGASLSAYLTVKGAGGQYGEDRIDQAAKVYIDKLIPDGYELFHKHMDYEEDGLDSVAYQFIYYNGVYYDAMQTIDLRIDNYGNLDDYDQLLAPPIVNLPAIKSKKEITDQIKGTGLQEVILVRNRAGDLEYRAYMKTNGAIYTLIYDAMTGERKEILAKSHQYYKRVALK